MLFPDYINFKSKGKPGDPKTPKNAASKPLSTPAADEDRPRTTRTAAKVVRNLLSVHVSRLLQVQ